MQGFITYVLILCFISPCMCRRLNVVTQNNTYNVMQYGAIGDGTSDDTQAFSSAWNSACNASEMSTLVIPSEKSFFLTNIIFSGPCNTKILIQLEGKIVLPSKKEWKSGPYWIVIKYLDGLTIDGNNKGEIDGNGSTWWDCPNCDRPGVFHFHKCNDVNVSNLKISNSPKAHVAINQCNGTTFSNISINSPATSPNTDGFDIAGSTNILIQDSHIETGDDCIAINHGSYFINATRLFCGPGHGISVGSLGKNGADDRVSNIYIQNCTFTNTTNGARIKTFEGGSGYAREILFEQIILEHVKNPIIIDQKYNPLQEETSSVSVSSVTYRGFSGTYVGKIAIMLDCSTSGCFDILLEQNNIVAAENRGETSVICRNVHGTIRDTVPNVPCLSP